MRALELRFDGSRRAIETNRALVTAEAGVPVLLEGALDELGYLTPVTDLYLDEIGAMTSVRVARSLRAIGLERMHDYLAPDQVAELIPRLHGRALDLSIPLVRTLVEATTSNPRPHDFICARTWIRAAMPYRLVEKYPEILQAGHLGGHLVPVTPHRDVDVTMPHDSLSLWSAVGPVREGNTISLFEDSEADPARSITPSLAPGDMLVFNGDCLHSSVRNDTDETRVAIGNRVVLGRRLRFGSGTHWRLWYDASMLDTPLAPFATLQSRLSRAALRRWRWRRAWEKQQRTSSPTTAS
jgi:hypothetical protein